MRRTILALGFVFVAAVGAAADDGMAVVNRAWEKAMLANDAAAAAALYAPDAVLYPPDAMELRGRDAIRKNYEGLIGPMKILDAKLTAASIETRGDLSISWGRWMLKVVARGGGDPVVWEGRYIAAARKLDGKWLIVADHASPAPPAPAPAPAGK